MLAAWASSAASRLGGGQKARVAARGPKRKPPLLAAALPWADQLPRARLQLSCIVTLPSRLSSIVYVVPGLGRVVPWAESIDWTSTSRHWLSASWAGRAAAGATCSGTARAAATATTAGFSCMNSTRIMAAT